MTLMAQHCVKIHGVDALYKFTFYLLTYLLTRCAADIDWCRHVRSADVM